MLSEVTKSARKTLQDRESDRKIRYELTKALQVLADTGITDQLPVLGVAPMGLKFLGVKRQLHSLLWARAPKLLW